MGTKPEITKVKAIGDPDFHLEKADGKYNYQAALTAKLDQPPARIDQNWINEVVLWKVNRYSQADEATLELLNAIHPEAKEVDDDLTRQVLRALLQTKGIQLPMASSILRFRNPQVYQIIDQRVYRVLYQGKTLKTTCYKSKKKREEDIEMYLNYLKDLRKACEKLEVEFSLADRVLYMADKRLNGGVKLKNYGSAKVGEARWEAE